MAAKSQPIVVGDRVHNCRAGAGTVTAARAARRWRDALPCALRRYHRAQCSLARDNLERLIPGDEGFEPPAVPMIEHRKDVSMAPIASPDTVKIEDDEF